MTVIQYKWLLILVTFILWPAPRIYLSPDLAQFLSFPLGPLFFFEPKMILSLSRMLHWIWLFSIGAFLLSNQKWAPLLLAGIQAILSALTFSTGKIDHNFILLTPLLAFGFFGYHSHAIPRIKKFCLFALVFFWASAGLVKATTGWLDPRVPSAIHGLYINYGSIYGLNQKTWILNILSVPWIGILFDYLTVIFELSFLSLLFMKKSFNVFIPWVICFHLTIEETMGIDFSSLAVFYAIFFLESDEKLGVKYFQGTFEKIILSTLLVLCYASRNKVHAYIWDWKSEILWVGLSLLWIGWRTSKLALIQEKERLRIPKGILFFDGLCAMCSSLVIFLSKRNPDQFKFAPLQGATFSEMFLIEDEFKKRPSFIVFYDKNFTSKGPYALLEVLKAQVGYVTVIILKIVPAYLLWLGYFCVAKIRHRIFRDQCSLVNVSGCLP